MRSSTLWDIGRRRDAPSAPPPARACVLGLPVDRLRMDEVVERVTSWIDQAGADRDVTSAESAGTLYAYHIVTLNPEIALASRRDAVLRRVITAADVVVADGTGIVWAARRAGTPCPARVTGIDLVERLAAVAAERGHRLYLLGAADGVADAAGRHLAQRYPGLVVAGTHSGSPRPRDDAETLRRIRAARPDIVVVAYGAPAQERWIARLRTRMGAVVAIGAGGTLDVLAGRVPRAPLWMRQAGIEWLYRLLRQPWRWRRVLALPQFVWAVLRSQASRGIADPSILSPVRTFAPSGGVRETAPAQRGMPSPSASSAEHQKQCGEASRDR